MKPKKKLKASGNYDSYNVIICNDYARKCYNIAQLVANHFMTNDTHFKEVHHKDGDASNNKINNLYWGNRK